MCSRFRPISPNLAEIVEMKRNRRHPLRSSNSKGIVEVCENHWILRRSSRSAGNVDISQYRQNRWISLQAAEIVEIGRNCQNQLKMSAIYGNRPDVKEFGYNRGTIKISSNINGISSKIIEMWSTINGHQWNFVENHWNLIQNQWKSMKFHPKSLKCGP